MERLAAFSDGVIAIIIPIMVLELKAPEGADLAALWHLLPIFLSYILSFVYVAVYWNNHYQLLGDRQRRSPRYWADLRAISGGCGGVQPP
jgi:uncharacterized membrane protein